MSTTLMSTKWGPLQSLVGSWEGNDGADWAYSHATGQLMMTTFRERSSFTPFGPVRNGRQCLYGLDHRSSMWRGDEAIPFHSEVGYWLWDADTGEILKAFVVPRGISVLAGGVAAANASQFTLTADGANDAYAIGQNRYLAGQARSVSYRLTVEIHADGTWGYEEVTLLDLQELARPFEHADHNTMRPA